MCTMQRCDRCAKETPFDLRVPAHLRSRLRCIVLRGTINEEPEQDQVGSSPRLVAPDLGDAISEHRARSAARRKGATECLRRGCVSPPIPRLRTRLSVFIFDIAGCDRQFSGSFPHSADRAIAPRSGAGLEAERDRTFSSARPSARMTHRFRPLARVPGPRRLALSRPTSVPNIRWSPGARVLPRRVRRSWLQASGD